MSKKKFNLKKLEKIFEFEKKYINLIWEKNFEFEKVFKKSDTKETF